jgi:mono/diheme cytochrome c family protein
MTHAVFRRARIIPLVALAFVAAAAVAADPTTQPAAAAPHSVLDGIYSNDQVARGEKAYLSTCARCHGENLLGNDDAPALVDKDFLDHWYGKPLGKLVDLTWEKMPSDAPGRLNRRESTDITTYLLSQNGYPAGKSDLVTDAKVLNGILIEAKK